MAISEYGSCLGKQKFKTDASARRRAKFLKVTGAKEDRGQWPYYCKECRCWHLTSIRRNKNGKNRKQG